MLRHANTASKESRWLRIGLPGRNIEAILAKMNYEPALRICKRMLGISVGGNTNCSSNCHIAINRFLGYGYCGSQEFLGIELALVDDCGRAGGARNQFFNI